MQGGVLGLGQRGVHGEVRLFAVHGHHLGERLQLKCKERKEGGGGGGGGLGGAEKQATGAAEKSSMRTDPPLPVP